MDDAPHSQLSRRERQIMQVLYRLGKASAAEVQEAIPDPPSYSAVRALLRILEEKGYTRHSQDGARYLYEPRVSRNKARRSLLKSILHDFFKGSREELLAALLDDGAGELSDDELNRLSELIQRARKEGR